MLLSSALRLPEGYASHHSNISSASHCLRGSAWVCGQPQSGIEILLDFDTFNL